MISFQEVILRLQDYWNKQGCALLQPIDTEVGAGTLTRQPSSGPLGRSPGVRPMFSRPAVRRTPATARTRTAFISITSSRLS